MISFKNCCYEVWFLPSTYFSTTYVVKFYQAFIKTAATIYKKIQDGVFDVSNEVSFTGFILTVLHCLINLEEISVLGEAIYGS